jgi:hypothetical protein
MPGASMAGWLSYGLSDFLLFPPRAYWRLFELQNAALWPLPLAALAAGLVVLALASLRPRHHARWIALILAILWAWVGWSFLWRLYATINWAAAYVALAFALQAALLLIAAWRDPPTGTVRGPRSLVGVSLIGAAVMLYPLMAPVLGRPWAGAEIFGMAPDPTAIGTLGFLLLLRGRRPLALLPIPLIWCALSGLTLWGLARVTP